MGRMWLVQSRRTEGRGEGRQKGINAGGGGDGMIKRDGEMCADASMKKIAC